MRFFHHLPSRFQYLCLCGKPSRITPHLLCLSSALSSPYVIPPISRDLVSTQGRAGGCQSGWGSAALSASDHSSPGLSSSSGPAPRSAEGQTQIPALVELPFQRETDNKSERNGSYYRVPRSKTRQEENVNCPGVGVEFSIWWPKKALVRR